MKKTGIVRLAAAVLAVILIAFLIVCAIWHKAAYAVFKNLTVQRYDMDESADWDGGKTYLKVPYAEESENQYLDLYVPEHKEYSDSDSKQAFDRPSLFVMVHGGGFIGNDSQSRQPVLMYQYFRDH